MPTHRVNTLQIEVTTGDEALGQALIERLSALRERRLQPLLDRVFGELSPPGRLDRIDSLELELGVLPAEDFDDRFIEHLEAALRAALAQRLRVGSPTAEASLELLRVFARTGSLPWWADRRERGLVGAQLRQALRETPAAFRALLQALSDDPAAIQRLAAACDPPTLEAVAGWAWPGAAVQALAARLNPSGEARAQAAIGGAVLTLAQEESTTDPLFELISILHISYPEIAARLEERLEAQDQAPIAETVRDAAPRFVAARAAATRRLPERSRWRRVAQSSRRGLAYVPIGIRDGVVMRWAEGLGAAPPGSKAPGASSAKWIASEDRKTAKGAKSAKDAKSGKDAQSLGAEARDSDDGPDEALAPGPGVLRRVPRTLAVHPALVQGAEHMASRSQTPIPQAQTPIPQAQTPIPQAQTPIPQALQHKPPPDPRRLAVSRRKELASLDQLHIDDGGLVLLWPFFERFFARLDLTDPERRFVSDDARQTAIALLSVLVHEDPEPPEWRLILPKILCGLSPEEPFALAHPLTQAQLDESERLLTAVIAHATILREMPNHQLRSSFLRREGTLTTRAGAWLLQVERMPYDLVLDRFPWSWGWIRLPWMPDSLQVEW